MLYSNVLPCPSISDHDAPYLIAKIPTNKYQPYYKFIGDMKNSNLHKYFDDFKQLPFSIVYSFDNPDDQLDTLNKIILECSGSHTPLKGTEFTGPPAPWLKNQDIIAFQNQRNKLRHEAYSIKDKTSMGVHTGK